MAATEAAPARRSASAATGRPRRRRRGGAGRRPPARTGAGPGRRTTRPRSPPPARKATAPPASAAMPVSTSSTPTVARRRPAPRRPGRSAPGEGSPGRSRRPALAASAPARPTATRPGPRNASPPIDGERRPHRRGRGPSSTRARGPRSDKGRLHGAPGQSTRPYPASAPGMHTERAARSSVCGGCARTLEQPDPTCSRRCVVPTSTPRPARTASDAEAPAGDSSPPTGAAPTRDVVVGVDGSECGLGAVRWAAREAARRGAPLRIVHAAPYLRRRVPTGDRPRARARPADHRAGVHRRPAHRADVRVRHRGRARRPGDTLLRAAAARSARRPRASSTTGAARRVGAAPRSRRGVAARSPRAGRRRPPAARQHARRTGRSPRCSASAIPRTTSAVAAFAADGGAPVRHCRSRCCRPASRASAAGRLDRTTWRSGAARPRPRGAPRRPAAGVGRPAAARPRAPRRCWCSSAGHGTCCTATLDGPHRWLLRHCTSPMAFVPPVHRRELDPREEIVALG